MAQLAASRWRITSAITTSPSTSASSAPSAGRPARADWLRDAISIFEQNGWDWSYHAFREWQGWSVEYGPDKNATAPSATPTDRELLLRSWYTK